MSFLTQLDNIPCNVTRYTFGFTEVRIYKYGLENEYFELRYLNQGTTKLTCCSLNLPSFISSQIKVLYYGGLNYCYVGYKSPAFQIISLIRQIMNYYKRLGLNYEKNK